MYRESPHLSPQIQTPTRLQHIAEQRHLLSPTTCFFGARLACQNILQALFCWIGLNLLMVLTHQGACPHKTTVAKRSLMILIRQQRLTTFHGASEPTATLCPIPGENARPAFLSNRNTQLPTATLNAQLAFLRDLCVNIEAVSELRLNGSPAMHRCWLQLGGGDPL